MAKEPEKQTRTSEVRNRKGNFNDAAVRPVERKQAPKPPEKKK